MNNDIFLYQDKDYIIDLAQVSAIQKYDKDDTTKLIEAVSSVLDGDEEKEPEYAVELCLRSKAYITVHRTDDKEERDKAFNKIVKAWWNYAIPGCMDGDHGH